MEAMDTMETMDSMVEDTVGEQRQEAWLTREQELASFLFARNNYLKEHEHEKHDMYEGEDASTKMIHLMHSDTMTVVIALIVMICVGLLFRSLCLRLTRDKTRKERIRGGLKALADHMNSVTRSMSNDPNPDSDGGGGRDQHPQGQVPHRPDHQPGEPEGPGVLKHTLKRGRLPALRKSAPGPRTPRPPRSSSGAPARPPSHH